MTPLSHKEYFIPEYKISILTNSSLLVNYLQETFLAFPNSSNGYQEVNIAVLKSAIPTFRTLDKILKELPQVYRVFSNPYHPPNIVIRDSDCRLSLFNLQRKVALMFRDIPEKKKEEFFGPVQRAIRTILENDGNVFLHAASVTDGKKGILIVGPSKSGKTTLTLLFLLNGWSIVNDDITILKVENNKVRAIGFPYTNGLIKRVGSLGFSLNSIKFEKECLISVILLLNPSKKEDGITILETQKGDGIYELLFNRLPQTGMLKNLHLREAFNTLCLLAQNAEIYKIKIGKNSFKNNDFLKGELWQQLTRESIHF